jgi:hypothetical protein
LKSEQVFKHLRRAEHLSVVEFDLVKDRSSPFEYPPDVLEGEMNAWKRGFTDVLKDSPSKDRKHLRWRIVHTNPFAMTQNYDIVESGESEVFSRTSL